LDFRDSRRNCASAFVTEVFSVGVLEFFEQTLALRDVVKGDFCSSSVAVSCSTALVGIWSARSDLLRR